jgi:hypothetical protein
VIRHDPVWLDDHLSPRISAFPKVIVEQQVVESRIDRLRWLGSGHRRQEESLILPKELIHASMGRPFEDGVIYAKLA